MVGTLLSAFFLTIFKSSAETKEQRAMRGGVGQNNEKGKIYILPGHVRIKNNLNDAGLGCFDNLSAHLMAVFKARCQKEIISF